MTQFDQYVSRGRHLKDISLYDYVACVRMTRVRKRRQSTAEIGAEDGILFPPRGRPRLHRFSFETGDCFDESFAQVISSVPEIPLVGPAPPQYPGNRPLPGDSSESHGK